MSAVQRLAPLPRWLLAATLAASALAAACGDDLGATPGGTQGAAGSPGRVTSGAALYKQHCASCHGPAGEGGSGKKLKG